MLTWYWYVSLAIATVFVFLQLIYAVSFLVEAYFFTRPRNIVRIAPDRPPVNFPYIVLFYPVLRELEATMHTTFLALADLDYPKDRYEVVAIPNDYDTETVASLKRLQEQFPFVKLLEIPPTSHPSWDVVWRAWDNCSKAYWWHGGKRAGIRDLPPKKTRQLIYAFYHRALAAADGEDFLVNYIDADSAPPKDHFLAAAYGMEQYDVLQATNIAGNLLKSIPASFHAFDHMAWDGLKYPHLSANGKHPYWVLGKGLFFKASDLVELGGFHPWITIEDPEVGMRFWKNGRRLGIIEQPLIEEVPETFAVGIKQRKRWVAGFWQSLTGPLNAMGFTRREKLLARLNFYPCLSLSLNALGFPVSVWTFSMWLLGPVWLPKWTLVLAALNALSFVTLLSAQYWSTWRRSRLVLSRRRDRLAYLLRVNPLMLWLWWLIWLVPLWIGWRMYRMDGGLVWERTDKIDANAELVRHSITNEAAPSGDFSVPQ